MGVVLVVTCGTDDVSYVLWFQEWQKGLNGHTEVEVVLHAVTEDQDTGNGVDKGCINQYVGRSKVISEDTYEHQKRSCR